MKTLSIDIETYSSVDLAKCGVYKYTEATDFDILLFGYSADGNPVQVVDLASGETIPPEVIAALTNDDVTKWAFNAQFERICLSRWLRDHGGVFISSHNIPEDTVGNYLDPTSWKCTMIWSAYMGLPLSLEGVGAVLGSLCRRAARTRTALPRPAAAGGLVLRRVLGASCPADAGIPAVCAGARTAAGRDVPGVSRRQLCAGGGADGGKPPAWQGHKKAGIKIKDA